MIKKSKMTHLLATAIMGVAIILIVFLILMFTGVLGAKTTDLTITTKSTAAVDINQVFIFNIKGKAGTDTERINLTVTVVGNDSVTVAKLPTGDYTVIELTDWSWRYENSTAIREVKLDYSESGNEIIFDNSRENGKWLDGNDVKNNKF